MSHTDAIGFNILSQLGKISITQVAGSHLDAHFVLTGVKLSIKMNAMQRYTKPFAKIDAELFIALALFTAEMKITMGSAYAHSQLLQDKEQRHAVGST